jgi:hypothetical protein
VINFLKRNKIEPKEFSTILQILMNDYDMLDLKQLLKNLSAPPINDKVLTSLILLANRVSQGKRPQDKHFRYLRQIVAKAELVEEAKLDSEFIVAAKQLIQCDIFSFHTTIANYFPHLNF